MKGIGNYRSLPTSSPRPAAPTSSERRMGMVREYQGPRASVLFTDGTTYAMPAAPFRALRLVENERFFLVTTFVGRQVHDVRVERVPDVRPTIAGRPTPKVYMRDGLKVATRR